MLKRLVLLIFIGMAICYSVPAQISVTGSLTRYQESVPGEKYEGIVSITNTGKEVAQARMYFKDYSFSADGKIGYLEPGSVPRSNIKWISLPVSTILLAPGESADVKYIVDIPASATLAGTYWSLLFIEAIPDDTKTPESDEPTITIKQVMRYGIQIVSDITANSKSDLKFSNTKIVVTPEGRVFTVDLTNAGTRWLNGDLYLEVYNSAGDHITTLSGVRFRTYPETSTRKTFSLVGLSPGTYKALLVADCGGDDLFGGNYNLVITE